MKTVDFKDSIDSKMMKLPFISICFSDTEVFAYKRQVSYEWHKRLSDEVFPFILQVKVVLQLPMERRS